MELRPYRDEDWAVVCEIYDLSKPDELRGVVESSAVVPLDADQKMSTLFRDSRIVVMEDAGRVVGFAGNRDKFITWLFVHPNSRRQGVGAALIGKLLTELRGPVTLNVVASNAAELALYRSVGFTVEREYPGNFQGSPCQVAKLRHEVTA